MRWVAALVILPAFAVPAEALATVTSSLVGGQLVVASDGSDSISVACAGGLVKVNGADPGTGAAVCTAVSFVQVSGGPGPNTLDVGGVRQAPFGPYVPCYLYGNGGPDRFVGSQVFNYTEGGPGSDETRVPINIDRETRQIAERDEVAEAR